MMSRRMFASQSLIAALLLTLSCCSVALAQESADGGDLGRFIRIWTDTHTAGTWDGVGDLVPDGVLDHKDAQAFAEAHTQGLRVFTTLQGKVTDVDGLPVYGATVTAGTPVAGTSSVGSPTPGVVSAQTAQDGSFSLLVTRLPGNLPVKADAPGYAPRQVQVAVSGGTKPLSPVALTSRNAQRLAEIAGSDTQDEIKDAFEELALAVGNDEYGGNLADAHMAAVRNLLDQGAAVTIADLAAELALQGLKVLGESMTAESLTAILQAFVNVAYERPHDPRSLFALLLVSDAAGNYPATAPTLHENWALEPLKATALFEALYMCTVHPQAASAQLQGVVRTASWRDVGELAAGIGAAFVKFPLDTAKWFFTPPSAEANWTLAGETIGAVAGVAVVAGVAGALAATGVGAVAIPYLLNPYTFTVASAVGSFIGGKVAMWLYKSTNKAAPKPDPDKPIPGQPIPGQPVSEEHVAQIAMNLSGYVVPRSSLRVAPLQWVWVPPGEFMMGSPKGNYAQPAHRVRITKGFWLSKYEVTIAQYAAFLTAHGPVYDEDGNEERIYGLVRVDEGWWISPGRENYPVASLSWSAAKAYCDHYGLRLPTEAEWEYAARGTDGRALPWGDTLDPSRCVNLLNGEPYAEAMPVGSVPAGDSWCGASDMAGNVQEWCQDWWGQFYYDVSPVDDPPGPVTGQYRIVRGGSFIHYVWECASFHRRFYSPNARGGSLGFRPVRTP